MSDSKKLFWNTFAQVASKATTAATSIFIIAALTRYLGPGGFGDYSTIFAYLGVAAVLVDLGLFVVAVRKLAQEPTRAPEIIGSLFGLKLFLGLVVFGLAVLFISLWPIFRGLMGGLLLAALAELLASLSLVPLSFLQARLLMPLASLSDVGGRFLNLLLVLGVIAAQLSLPYLIGAVMIGNLAVLGLNLFWARRVLSFKRWNLPLWWQLLKEALPLGLVLVLAAIYFRIDTLMLYLMKGRYEVGLYGAPYKILEVLLAFPSIFGGSVFALMSSYFKESRQKVAALFHRAFDINALLSLPLVGGILVVALPVILLINGPEFSPSASALRILALALVGAYLNSVMIYTLLAAGKQRLLLGPYLLAALFNIVTNLIFIPRYGFLGASLTTVATEFLVLFYTSHLVKKELALRLEWGVLGRAFLASLFMLVFLLSQPSFSLPVAVAVGGILYGALLWGMHLLKPSFIRFLFKLEVK